LLPDIAFALIAGQMRDAAGVPAPIPVLSITG
jgi:hypothetical protein